MVITEHYDAVTYYQDRDQYLAALAQADPFNNSYTPAEISAKRRRVYEGYLQED